MVEVVRPMQAIDDDGFEDETLGERLWGLTEMFPDPVRNGTHSLKQLTTKGIENAYTFTRSAMWICGTSFIVLALPVLFEVERVQTEEAALMQQRQILLGPGGGGQQAMPGQRH